MLDVHEIIYYVINSTGVAVDTPSPSPSPFVHTHWHCIVHIIGPDPHMLNRSYWCLTSQLLKSHIIEFKNIFQFFFQTRNYVFELGHLIRAFNRKCIFSTRDEGMAHCSLDCCWKQILLSWVPLARLRNSLFKNYKKKTIEKTEQKVKTLQKTENQLKPLKKANVN